MGKVAFRTCLIVSRDMMAVLSKVERRRQFSGVARDSEYVERGFSRGKRVMKFVELTWDLNDKDRPWCPRRKRLNPALSRVSVANGNM